MNKTHYSILLFAVGILLLGGCTQSVFVTKYDGKAAKGVIYSLPKTLLRVNITYTLREKVTFSNGSPTSSLSVFVTKPIEIAPVTTSDPKNSFVLSGEDITKNIFLESGLDFKMTDDGILKSVDSDIKDKSADVVKGFVSSGIKIASIAAVAGGKVPQELEPVMAGIKNIYKEIGDFITLKTDQKRSERLTELNTQLKAAYSVIEMYYQKNRDSVKDTDIKYSVIIDPDEFTYVDAAHSYEYKFNPQIVPGIPAAAIPVITIRLLTGSRVLTQDVNFNASEKVQGVVYRKGRPVITTVTIHAAGQDAEVLRENICFAQFGDFGTAFVDSKGASNSKTSVTFSTVTGSITEYKIDNGSSADKVVTAIDSSLSNIQKGITDIQYNLKIQDIQKQQALVDAEKKLLESQKALEEAQKK